MSNIKPESESQHGDIAPGDEQGADHPRWLPIDR